MADQIKIDPKNCPEFERPILELEAKIVDLEGLADTTKSDFTRELASLRDLRNKMVHKIYSSLGSWDRVKLARHTLRPLTSDYIDLIFENFDTEAIT